MGFLSKLFGNSKKESVDSTKKKKLNHFLTNSDELGLGTIKLSIAGVFRIDGLLAISEMDEIAKKRKKDFDFSVMHTTLLDEGALTVPVVCTIGDEKYSIYFIYDKENMSKYNDLVKQVSRTPYPKLLYFSSIPIYETQEEKSIIEPFQLADLRVDKDAKITDRYAMWWSTEDDPYFYKSKTFDYLAKLNELLNGYETYMTGYVLRQVRVLEDQELKRMNLPDDGVTFVIDAPEEKRVLLDISQEKGIRFMFQVGNTTKEYRERFLKGVLVDFAANIIPLRQNEFPVDEKKEPNSYDWFNFMSEQVKEEEKAGEIIGHEIGIIGFDAKLN